MPRILKSDPRVQLRAWRRAYGLTQSAVAESVGISQSQYSRQETAGRVGMTYLVRYAEAFGVSVDALLDGPPQLKSQDCSGKRDMPKLCDD